MASFHTLFWGDAGDVPSSMGPSRNPCPVAWEGEGQALLPQLQIRKVSSQPQASMKANPGFRSFAAHPLDAVLSSQRFGLKIVDSPPRRPQPLFFDVVVIGVTS